MTHESEELNQLLGKKVEIVWFDGETSVGILRRAKKYYERGIYALDVISGQCQGSTITFHKSHVKKISEV